MMAHISSTLCAFFLFLMFIMIEQAQFLEFNNYDDESLDSERPSALRYHLPYEHRLYDDIYDHETSESQYGEYSPDMALNEMDDYVQQSESESDSSPYSSFDNDNDDDDDDDDDDNDNDGDDNDDDDNNYSSSSKPKNTESSTSTTTTTTTTTPVLKSDQIISSPPFQATQSVAVQEINTKSGHFRWRILTDMNAMKSTIVR
ncbi:uncharacterized protein LOC142597556 [Dermatophagoides farinae]|uniref:uncharacterized protein LOC142597556 n=1 Tax=Dermatophagoides farinae TaxID=6954 RepID=UPI003F5D70BC